MSFTDFLGAIGKGVASLIPGGGLAVAALEGIAGMAEAIGGDKGKKIKDGLEQVQSGLKEIGETPLTPEVQMRMQESKFANEKNIRECALKEKAFKFDDQAGGREVVKTALTSADPLVRQARPKMMVRLGNFSIAYSFLAPAVVIVGGIYLKESLVAQLIEVMLWQGGLLWGSFTTSFTGYTVARSADKRAENGMASSKLFKGLAKAGKLIS